MEIRTMTKSLIVRRLLVAAAFAGTFAGSAGMAHAQGGQAGPTDPTARNQRILTTQQAGTAQRVVADCPVAPSAAPVRRGSGAGGIHLEVPQGSG